MVYLACDVVNPKSEKIIKRYLYGIAISQLDKWNPDMDLEDHRVFIKKEVRKKIASKKRLHEKAVKCKARLRTFAISYKDAVKSGIDFEVFHPPGFQMHSNIDPFPTGKDNRGLR